MKYSGTIATLIMILIVLSCCNDRSGKTFNPEPLSETHNGSQDMNGTELKSLLQTSEIVKDIEGNEYNTIKIGKQTWMLENLRTTKYNDGTDIPLVTDAAEWRSLSTPGFCWYQNEESFGYANGALYNGYAVGTGKLCPAGWRVPSDADWTVLTNYLGGGNIAGDKMKQTGTNYWVSPNSGATNESGFTALPGGLRYLDGEFHDFGFSSYWWSSTEYSETRAFFFYIDYEHSNLFRFDNVKKNGFSVRCIKNE